MELTERQHATIQAGRQAMRDRIAADYPGDLNSLLAVAIAGAFSTMCRRSAGETELLRVINQELAAAGLEVVRKRRH